MGPKIEQPQGPSGDPDVLMGWKAIAAYLGKSVRSVQRWEQDLGMPTHRIRTPDGQIAYAKRSEVDAWLVARDRPTLADPTLGDAAPVTAPVPARSKKWPLFVLGLAAVAVFSITEVWLGRASKIPARSVLTGRNLEVRDDRGRVLWVHHFDTEVFRGGSSWLERVHDDTDSLARVDLGNDGSMVTLVPVRFGSPAAPTRTDALYAFSDDGHVLWAATAAVTLSCGGETFSGPWNLLAVLVSDNPGPKRVWVSYTHNRSWPSFVSEVSPVGSLTLRYLQSGWITTLAEWHTASGLRLVAGGVLSEHDRPSLATFDPDGPTTTSPHVDPKYNCQGAPRASPDRVTLFPNSELVRAGGFAYTMVHRVHAVGPDLRAETDYGQVLAFVAPDGTVKERVLTDAYWFRHRELEALGKLTHSADDCPERVNPVVIRYWTEAGSWQTYAIPQTGHAGTQKR
jgi:hypothetical protein